MQFGNYRFLIKLTDDAFLPYYKGSTFRGLLGHAMRGVVCPLKRNECSSCILCSTCTYALAFETGLALSLPDNSRVSAPPHPMVLEPPLTEKREFKKGEILECGLLLFGKINKNLPYFIHAFGEMGRIGIGKKIGGKRAGFVLERVSSGNEVIFSKDNGVVSLPQPLDLNFSFASQDNSFSDRLKIQMITPLRILKGNAGKADLSFPLLLRSMIRRTTSLLNTYGQGEPQGDYALLVKKAEEVNHAELRSPPFKNALRYWWRLTQGDLSAGELLKSEQKLFGGVNDKASRSLVDIVVTGDVVTSSLNERVDIGFKVNPEANGRRSSLAAYLGMGSVHFTGKFEKAPILPGQIFKFKELWRQIF